MLIGIPCVQLWNQSHASARVQYRVRNIELAQVMENSVRAPHPVKEDLMLEDFVDPLETVL